MPLSEVERGYDDVQAKCEPTRNRHLAHTRQVVIAAISTCAFPTVYISIVGQALGLTLTVARCLQVAIMVTSICYCLFWIYLLLVNEKRRRRYFTRRSGDVLLLILAFGFGPLIVSSFYFAPLGGDDPQHLPSPSFFLFRLCFLTFLTSTTGMDVELFLPPTLIIYMPLCSALALASGVRKKEHHAQDPSVTLDSLSSMSILELSLLILLLVIALPFVLLVVSVVTEDEGRAVSVTLATAKSTGQPLPSAVTAAPLEQDPIIDSLSNLQARIQSFFSSIPFLSAWLQRLYELRYYLRSLWKGVDASSSHFILWPFAISSIALQLYRLSWGSSASPLEVLVLFFAGLVVGTLEAKDIQAATRNALSSVSALAHDLVPAHVLRDLLSNGSVTSNDTAIPRDDLVLTQRLHEHSRLPSGPEDSLNLFLAPSPVHSFRDSSFANCQPSTGDTAPQSPHPQSTPRSCDGSHAAADANRQLVRSVSQSHSSPFRSFNRPDRPLSSRFTPRVSEVLRKLNSGFELSQQPPPIQPLPDLNLVAYQHDCVTVLFADLCNFTDLSSKLSPQVMFAFLNELYARYDSVVERFDVYKVETIGDCYMCCTGLINPDPDHATKMVAFALEMQRQAAQVYLPDGSGLTVKTRIGLHSGPVLSGVIGKIRKRYCVVGSTVNIASRMESTGQEDRIHVSRACRDFVGSEAGHEWEDRGEVQVKGIGPMQTFFLRQDLEPGDFYLDHSLDKYLVLGDDMTTGENVPSDHEENLLMVDDELSFHDIDGHD